MTDLARLRIAVDTRDLTKADAALKKLENTGSTTTSALGKLPAVFGAIAGSMAVKQAIQYADTMKLIEGRLSLVTSSSSDLIKVQKELFDISQRSRVGFADTADLYARIARSTDALGYSQQELLNVTETISKSFVISGASAEAANAAIIQLGQGFASGTLRGDELNSVMEQSPRLAQAIADGMGVTVGKLRALGAEGKITAESVMEALKSQGDSISMEFGKMPATVGQSLEQINNSLMEFIGNMDKATGTTSGIASFFESIADSISETSEQWSSLFISQKGVKELNSQLEIQIKLVQLQRDLTEELETSTTFMWNSDKKKRRENIQKLQEEIEFLNQKSDAIKQNEIALKAEQEAKKGQAAAAPLSDKEIEKQNKANERALELLISITGSGYDQWLADANSKMVILGESTNITTQELMAAWDAMSQTGAGMIGPSEDNADYLAKLQERKDALIASLYPTEGIAEQFEAQREVIAELEAQGLEMFGGYEAAKTAITEQENRKQQALEMKKAQFMMASAAGVAGHASKLISLIGGENKAAALAVIAIQTGLGIAQTMINTKVAGMRALAELGPIAGPPAVAAIEAMGAASIGIIGATGLVQGGMALGGGGGGLSTSGGGAQPQGDGFFEGVQTREDAVATTKEVTINLGDNAFVSTEMVRELIKSINDEIGDGVRIRT